MKKHGFTLAEVLVTLGIIGVVAALTTPALIQNVGNAKIGPKLQKAKATFETAAQMMLTENNSNTILGVSETGEDLGKELTKYMKIKKSKETNYKTYKLYENGAYGQSLSSYTRFDSEDGMIYFIVTNLKKRDVADKYPNTPNNQFIGSILVDVDGASGKNTTAKDLFWFYLYNDGTLRPYGARAYNRSTMNSNFWYDNDNCTKNGVKLSTSCTGSIFDNGMKIIYE